MIRKANLNDLLNILFIEESCFNYDRLSLSSIKYMIKNKQALFLIFEVESQIAGYILTLIHKRAKLARHYSLAVLPKFTQHSIAYQLMLEVEKNCKSKEGIKLELKIDNLKALKLYEKLGYKIIGEKPYYYEDGTTALFMEKLFV